MKILGHKTIYRDEEYVAFPNFGRTSDGTILCAFRHAIDRQKEYGRVTHVDPTAKDVFIRSFDDGQTFDPTLHTILDGEMSVQDPCINILSTGRIIVTYFRWLLCPLGTGLERWGDMFTRYGRSLHGKYDCYPNGAAYSISDDNGETWRHMPDLHMEGIPAGGGVRGNIVEMPDGSLRMPTYGAMSADKLSSSQVIRSDDQGETWYFYGVMADDPNNEKHYLEPGLFLTDSGKLIGLHRTQLDYTKPEIDFEESYLDLHIATSEDGGKTFGEVKSIKGMWGSSPFHALKLASGKVLVTYGYRRAPFGIRAKLCNGELSDLETAEEIILRDDGPHGDLGYPHSIQLENGDILVGYYISGQDDIRKIDVTYLRED